MEPLDAASLPSIPTPALLLDLDVLESNLDRMARKSRELGVALRPHIKTHKCVEIAERQRALGSHGITVSTLEEARVFARHGFNDITWAFPVVLARLEELADFPADVRLGLTLDCRESLQALESLDRSFPVWLKVDCGYGRAGVDPRSEEALQLAAALAGSSRLEFAGILSHSGNAYHADSASEIAAIAGQESRMMAGFARHLRRSGITCPAISVGSTPSMARVDRLTDVTEVRPGNYALYDYTQLCLGSCSLVDCAVTVLASVVSSRLDARRSVTDAGALALSKDSGPDVPVHFGRLLVENAASEMHPSARVLTISQEHGVLNEPLPVGTRVRILPNHACLTVACFDAFHVVREDRLLDTWKVWRQR